MKYDFLKQFSRRMKWVGMYSTIVKNSMNKTTWKQFNFETFDEQLTIVYAVLLFVMEKSLREKVCTIDDISAYVDDICTGYLNKGLTYAMSFELTEFIVNIILCDEGHAMYFKCYDFDKREYKDINISYITNEIVYIDGIKRTSYKLTDNGYNLLLSTLEIENNMKLTIHEMIFKMHLERATYDKALDEVKNIFNLMRIQLQKIEEAMNRIRRNVLNYSVSDYQKILQENLTTIDETNSKFAEYRNVVITRAKEIEEKNIDIGTLDDDDIDKLSNLQLIEKYLDNAIDEYQKILNRHFDMKELYSKELERMSHMALIKRFSLRSDLYDEVIRHPGTIKELDCFLRPLFLNNPDKIYNINKCIQLQKPIRKNNENEEEEVIGFDAADFEEEKERKLKQRLEKYKKSVNHIIDMLCRKKKFRLDEIKEDESYDKEILIPSVEIFKEIMVEFIRVKSIDIKSLMNERKRIVSDDSLNFQLNEVVIQIIQERQLKEINHIYIERTEENEVVVFDDVIDEDGSRRTIKCSNILFARD